MRYMKGQLTVSDIFELFVAFILYLFMFVPVVAPAVATTVSTYFSNTSDPQSVATAILCDLINLVVLAALLYTAFAKASPKPASVYQQ